MLRIYSFSIDSEQLEELKNKTDNVSLFIRQAIDEKLNRKFKDFDDLEKVYLEKLKEMEEIEQKYLKALEEKLINDKQMTIEQKEKLEKSKKEQAMRDKYFHKFWEFLENYDEIKNFEFKENWDNDVSIRELVVKLNEKLLADKKPLMAELQLLRYLRIKQHIGSAEIKSV